MDRDEKEDGASKDHEIQPHVGSTLLPAPIANAISLVTRSSSLYLRLGTFIGGLALDGARVTTLTGLELSRAVIEGILSRAGRDVTSRSIGELGRADAEGLLERSIATLHSTITSISFAASAGFHISSAALSSAGDASQHLLATLDSILGSTDSSRAIASIITLIRREFDNPATGQPGETVGVADLLMGICGLALLQRWCKKLTDLDAAEKNLEDVVWDVVILDDGRRADVVGSTNIITDMTNLEDANLDVQTAGIFMPTSGNEELLQTVQRRGSLGAGSDEWLEAGLKEHIMQSLPQDASVSISTETTTTKTITVEIIGAEPPDLSPPPGVEVVEETAHHTAEVDLDGEILTNEQKIALLVPRYRVVYRLMRNRMRSTNISAEGEVHETEEDHERRNRTANRPSSALSKRLSLDIKDVATPLSGKFSLSPPSSPEPEEKPQRATQLAETIRTSPPEKSNTMNTILPDYVPQNSSDQKRFRKPISSSSSISGPEASTSRKTVSLRPPAPKKFKSDSSSMKNSEKKGSIRNALRKGSGVALSNLWNKDSHPQQPPSAPEAPRTQSKPPFSVSNSNSQPKSVPSSQLPILNRGSSMVASRDAPRAPQRGNPNYFSSRDLDTMKQKELPRSPSRASYYSIHEHRRDSMVSQTDTYSVHSSDTRPGSPTAFRTHLKAQSSLLRAKSEKNIVSVNLSSPTDRAHRRAKSHVPSIYTLKTNASETSLILRPHLSRGAYDEKDALNTLARTGIIDGLFPAHHLVRNITRFIRFASASYGAGFMRVMGIGTNASMHGTDAEHHYEHHSFSAHTQLPPSTILLSSFVDPQGGTDSSGQTNTGVPMVHFISLDHESKAVVMTCRGTLGFEDILTDMTCDYDNLHLRGKTYKVHKGIYASALRLLAGEGSKVMVTLKAALDEFPEYGLVMCGHSLGGAVTALLAIMISEPNSVGYSFVTSSDTYKRVPLQITASSSSPSITPPQLLQLPAGRPIHVYAYGPPATMSPSLRLATRGLITTIVNGQDVVPYLSLGVLHDFQAIALAFKTDDSGAKGEVRSRVWAGLTNSFADKWYGGREGIGGLGNGEDDEWAYSALKTLRASMLSTKLVPPGEVFVIDANPVLQRDAFVAHQPTPPLFPKPVTENAGSSANPGAGAGAGAGIGKGFGAMGMGRGLGRPATRAELRFVRDVEKRFGELRFGGSMLLDHSPGRYEAALGALGRGVLL
jgi:hypothetical protein